MSLEVKLEERFAEHLRTMRRSIRLLVFVVVLIAIDSQNHQFRNTEYREQLPLVLHDFASKYESALLAWDASKSTDKADGPVSILFEKVYRPPQALTPGYRRTDEIPLLDEHIQQKLPQLMAGKRSFLGFKVYFPLYVMIVWITPNLLLLTIVVRVWLLRRTWRLIPSHAPRLITDILGFQSFHIERSGMAWFMATLISLFVLLMALLPPLLVTLQTTELPNIKGTLSLNPIGFPVLDGEYTQLSFEPTKAALSICLILAFVSLIMSVCMATMLIKRSACVRDEAQ